MGEPLLDEVRVSALIAELDSDPELFGAIVDVYLGELDTRIAAIEGAMTEVQTGAAEPAVLSDAAHTLKSASLTLGVAALAAPAARIETAARTGSALDGVLADLAQLRTLAAPVRGALLMRRRS